MSVVAVNFLHSLAKWAVARAAARSPTVALAYLAGPPRDLFRSRAVRDDATDPHSVIRLTGGPPPTNDPLPRASVQVMTWGLDAEAAMARAGVLYECLCVDPADTSGGHAPPRMVVIDGYKAADDSGDGHWLVVSIDPLQRPGYLGPDGEREQVAFNFDVGFVKKD